MCSSLGSNAREPAQLNEFDTGAKLPKICSRRRIGDRSRRADEPTTPDQHRPNRTRAEAPLHQRTTVPASSPTPRASRVNCRNARDTGPLSFVHSPRHISATRVPCLLGRSAQVDACALRRRVRVSMRGDPVRWTECGGGGPPRWWGGRLGGGEPVRGGSRGGLGGRRGLRVACSRREVAGARSMRLR